MKAFRSFSTTILFSFFPSSRCSWRSQGLQGCWEGLIHFLVVGSSFGVMMITSNLVLLFLFSWIFQYCSSSTAVLSGHYVGITGAFPLMRLYSRVVGEKAEWKLSKSPKCSGLLSVSHQWKKTAIYGGLIPQSAPSYTLIHKNTVFSFKNSICFD